MHVGGDLRQQSPKAVVVASLRYEERPDWPGAQDGFPGRGMLLKSSTMSQNPDNATRTPHRFPLGVLHAALNVPLFRLADRRVDLGTVVAQNPHRYAPSDAQHTIEIEGHGPPIRAGGDYARDEHCKNGTARSSWKCFKLKLCGHGDG